MPSGGNVSLFRHCYLAIEDESGKYVETISGQRDEETGFVVFADSFWDLNHLNNVPFWEELNGDTDDREFPFNTGKSSACKFAKCACETAKKLHGSFTYMQAWQNSNTFLSRLISKCGGMADFPNSAIAGPDVGTQPTGPPSW